MLPRASLTWTRLSCWMIQRDRSFTSCADRLRAWSHSSRHQRSLPVKQAKVRFEDGKALQDVVSAGGAFGDQACRHRTNDMIAYGLIRRRLIRT